MKITSLATWTLLIHLPFGTSAVGFRATNKEKDLQDQPRRERRRLLSGYHKQAVDCERQKYLLRADGDQEDDRRRKLSYVNSASAVMYFYTEGENKASSTGAGIMDDEVECEEGATTKQAVQIGMELICEPDYAQGDNPCVDGCGHAPVPNPFNKNPEEAAKLQVPSPCKNYDCLCADSGCARSWDIGCIKWYMQCQTQTQVCGSLDDAPTAVQKVNIGVGCTIAPTSANTEVCFFQELSTPAPTLVPSSSPTDVCDVEVEFSCVDAETGTIPCEDITSSVDLKCDCPEGAMDSFTFVYSGPDGATLDCNSGAFVINDLTNGMNVVIGEETDIPASMVCSVSVEGTVIDQFEVNSSCDGSGALVLEQIFGNNGMGGPILTFDGYTCESGESHSCSEEVTYIVRICNPGSGEEVVASVTLDITADGTVVESIDFTGSPPLGPLAGGTCIEFPHSSSINVCTEFVYEAIMNVEMVPPTSGVPCEGSSTIVFTSFGNTLPPTFTPTDSTMNFPTKAPTASPTKAPTEPPVTIVETDSPTDFPTRAPTIFPTKAPTEPPVTIVETNPPTLAPSSFPTGICDVEVEFMCVDAETENVPCGDITNSVDLKCDCPDGSIDILTFDYSGPDGATLDCNSGAFVITDLKYGMDVVVGPVTAIPDSMVCSVSVSGTVIDQFEVDSSCDGKGALVLEQTFGNNGMGGPTLTFDGYTCGSGESHFCHEEVTYIAQICNPSSGEQVVASVTLNITADGTVVESIDFTGSPPLGPLTGDTCIEFPHSSSINVCTEYVYEAVMNVEMVPPNTGVPCEGSSIIVFTSFGNTLPPTYSPSGFSTTFPTKAPSPSPTKAPTEPPVAIVETLRPTLSSTDFPTKAPTEPPVTIVESQPPYVAVPSGDDDDDDVEYGDDDDDGDVEYGDDDDGEVEFVDGDDDDDVEYGDDDDGAGGKGGMGLVGKGDKKGGDDDDNSLGKKGGYYNKGGDDDDSAKKGSYNGGHTLTGKKVGHYDSAKKGGYYYADSGKKGERGGPLTPTTTTIMPPTGPSKPVPVPVGLSKPVPAPL